MEKLSSLEDDNNGGRSGIMNQSKAYSWGIGSTEEDGVGEGGDMIGGFSWPPRSYTCTFCKREFRSAQALGGHMNVHRRDRARLRQMPSSTHLHMNCTSNYSFFNLNLDPNPNSKPNPNPNPNFSPYCFSSMPSTPTMLPPSSKQPIFPCVPQSSTHPSYRLRPRGCQMMKTQIPPYGVCKYDSFSNENEGKIVKKSEIVRLNLEIGLLGESKSDDLDLELRLGCS